MPQRLHPLTAEIESRFREYIRMLEVLATHRALEQIIEEEECKRQCTAKATTNTPFWADLR
jgi:hypothetical protein